MDTKADMRQPTPAGTRELLRASYGVIKLVARANPRLVSLIAVFALALGILPVAENAVRGSLINHLAAAAGSGAWTPVIALLLGGVIVAAYLSGVLSRLDNYFTNRLWQQTREVMEFEVIRAKTSLSLEQQEDPDLSNLIQRVTERGGDTSQFATDTMDLAAVCVTVIASAIAIATTYWWLLPAVFVGLLPQLVYQGIFSRELWHHNTSRTERWRHFWRLRTYFWSAKEITEVKLFGLIDDLVSRGRRIYTTLTKEDEALRRSQTVRSLWLGAIGQSVIAFCLAFFAWELIHGRMQVGTLTFLFATVVTLSSSLIRLFAMSGRQYERALYITDIIRLLEMESSMPMAANPRVLSPDATPLIRFENVSFSYKGAERPTLHDVSFELRPGDKVALIGVNGSGKTTLVKLLCRLYDPTSGRITVDGTDLREIDLQSYFRLFGTLFQDFNRYAMPVSDTIALGDVSRPAEQPRVQAAAEASEAASFIDAFSAGYGQMLGKDFSGGTDLSGGQWQKMAIARVFYRDPRIWVLDEPTAAVDAEAEARIFDRIEQLPEDRTALIISHRFSTVRNADRILVLKDGRIAEEGTHDQLMAGDKDYARLFTLQAKRYQGEA